MEELDLQRRRRVRLRKRRKAEYETGTGGGQMAWWEAVQFSSDYFSLLTGGSQRL